MKHLDLNATRLAAILLVAFATISVRADVPGDVTGLIAKLPAKNPSEEKKVLAAIADLGAPAYADLYNRLVAPGTGDDTKARLAISGLATYVYRPGAEKQRSVLAISTVAALRGAKHDEVKATILRVIGRIGKGESVSVLSEYLTHKTLSAEAIRALIGTGAKDSGERLLGVLRLVSDRNRPMIISALGDKKLKKAAASIAHYAGSEHLETRYATWAALAKIGDPKHFPFDEISKGQRAKKHRPRVEANDSLLVYAAQIGKNGNAVGCRSICRELIRTRSEAGDAATASAALATLVSATGADAMPDLIAAVDAGPELAAASLRLASGLRGETATKAWATKLASADAPLKAKIVEMLGRRGDKSALATIKSAAGDRDAGVKFAAISAAARLEGNSALPILLSSLEKSSGKEKGDLIRLCRRIGGKGALDVVAKAAKSPDASIREAAISTLISWPDASSAPAILSYAKGAPNDGERTRAIRAYVRIVRAARYPRDQMLKIFQGALEVSKSSEDKSIVLGGLENLKMIESLELIVSLLGDEGVRERAAQAAVQVAQPRKSGRGGLKGPRAASALEKALKVLKNKGARERGQKYLQSIR